MPDRHMHAEFDITTRASYLHTQVFLSIPARGYIQGEFIYVINIWGYLYAGFIQMIPARFHIYSELIAAGYQDDSDSDSDEDP